MQPALNVRGIGPAVWGHGGERGAHVGVALDRLPAGARPGSGALQQVVNAHLRAQGYEVVTDAAAASGAPTGSAWRSCSGTMGTAACARPFDAPVIGALQQVVADVYGRAPFVAPTLGGSLPLFHFADVFDAPLVTVPTVNADNSQHAPNENLRVGNLWDAIALVAAMVTELAPRWDSARVVP
jgi:acetylornithine deacetylase/succinyl-diaminopimelate desuccinylase-like protein